MPILRRPRMKAIFLVAFLGVFVLIYPARADVMDITASILSSIAQVIISLVSQILVALIQILLAVTQYNDFINAPAVIKGWVLVRDVSNLAFLVIFITIAFATILGVEKYEYKRLLPKLLIMAVFINFSRTICGLVLDAAQVVMMTFVNGFKDVAAGNLIRGFGLEDMLTLRDQAGGPPPDVTPNTVAAASLLAVVMLIIATITVGVIVVMFLVRILYLWILVLLSPLAFMLSAAPGLSGKFDEWWGKFVKYAISGPIMAFFLWLSFSIMASVQPGSSLASQNNLSTGSMAERTQATITKIGNSDQLLSYGIAIALLLLSLSIASEMGVKGGRLAEAAIGRIRSGAGGLAKLAGVTALTGGLGAAAGYGAFGTKKGRAALGWANRKLYAGTGWDLSPKRLWEGIKESREEKKKFEIMAGRGKAGARMERGGVRGLVGGFLGTSRDAADAYMKGFFYVPGMIRAAKTIRGKTKTSELLAKEDAKKEEAVDKIRKAQLYRKALAKKDYFDDGIEPFIDENLAGQKAENEKDQEGQREELEKQTKEKQEKQFGKDWGEEAKKLGLKLSDDDLKLSVDELQVKATTITDPLEAKKYQDAAAAKRNFRSEWEKEKGAEISAKAKEDYEKGDFIDEAGKRTYWREALTAAAEQQGIMGLELNDFIGKTVATLRKEGKGSLADAKEKFASDWEDKKARAQLRARAEAARDDTAQKELFDKINKLGLQNLQRQYETKTKEADRLAGGGLADGEIKARDEQVSNTLKEIEKIENQIKRNTEQGLPADVLQTQLQDKVKERDKIGYQLDDGSWLAKRDFNLVQERKDKLEEDKAKAKSPEEAQKLDAEFNEWEKGRQKMAKKVREEAEEAQVLAEVLDPQKAWDPATRASRQEEAEKYDKEAASAKSEADQLQRERQAYIPPRAFYAARDRRLLENEEMKKITTDLDTEMIAAMHDALDEKNQIKFTALMKKLAGDANENEFLNAFGFTSDSKGMHDFFDAVVIGKPGAKKADGTAYSGPSLGLDEQTAFAIENDIAYIDESRNHWETGRLMKVENGVYKRLSEQDHVMAALAEIMKKEATDIVRNFNRLAYGGERPRADGSGRDFEMAPLGIAMTKAFGPEFLFRFTRGEYNKNAIMNFGKSNQFDKMADWGVMPDFIRRGKEKYAALSEFAGKDVSDIVRQVFDIWTREHKIQVK